MNKKHNLEWLSIVRPQAAPKFQSRLACIALLALSQFAPSVALAAEPLVHRDVAYVPEGHARQKLDLYLPEAGSEPHAVIIWIHGGAWRGGDKANCPPLRQGYVQRGYAVASLNYRLSGDAVFPAQIEDCKAAVRWLRAHAAEYHLDPARFGVWGSSAGGHLVALLGTAGEVPAWDQGASSDQSSRVQAVCDYFGPTDFTKMETGPSVVARMRHDAPDSPESLLIGGPVQENREKAAKANPITYVDASDPPFLIVHGDKDPVVPLGQSQLLFDALKLAGVSVRLHVIEGAGHGKGFGGKEIQEMVADFFAAHLSKTAEKDLKPEAIVSRSEAVTEGRAGGMDAKATHTERPLPSVPAVPSK